MSIDLTDFGPAAWIIALVTLGGAALGLHLKNRVPGLGFRDNLRAMVYLTQYDGALEYHGLGRRELRARVDELRGNLAESSADVGLTEAIRRLGPPRVLAAEVAGTRLRPSWARGGLWVAAALAIGFFALLLSASAFNSVVDSAVAPGSTVSWSPFFWTMTATATDDGSSAFELNVPFITLLMLLVPFLVGARAWRLWTGRRADQSVDTP